jgi:malate synthase
VSLDLVRAWTEEELAKIEALIGQQRFNQGRFDAAHQLLDELVASDNFIGFLTLIAYDYLS